MKQKRRFQLHVGTASILLVFMTLCLTSFAVLSVVNANADKKLSDHLAERTIAYYNAVSDAERFIAEADRALVAIASQHTSEASFLASVTGEASTVVLTAHYPVSEYQYLAVELEPVFPSAEAETDGTETYPRAVRIAVYQIQTEENALVFDEPYLNLPH